MPTEHPQRVSDFAGRVVLVTGSSKGIGFAAARRFAERGATVVVNSRDAGRTAEAAAALTSAGYAAFGIAADLRSAGGPEALVAGTIAACGTIDVLVNNAGGPSVAPAATLPAEDWRSVLELNLTAPFLCAQHAGREMLARGRGVIVNVSSIFSTLALPLRTAYVVSKHGLDGLTSSLGVEWGPHGVRVVSVNPGYTATEFVERTMAAGAFAEADLVRRTPLRRLATPDEIADAIVYVASDAASYVNATHLFVDGGWTAYGGW
jgi:NAD(P)-dependent dehydrogenase (short-subunit alcohol dehydrogenase family)